ncbi:hypothetical protein V6N12_010554 [Hibiscus sabdariffa]|uniref:Uncharacterized protein n=1 Tax=Hibiscus sabdariffa TaxID=183260 RepID=A0ABR2EKR5_9ROSI
MPNEWHTPLEVPGNRLPETGSRWKLLNVRGAWQEVWMQKIGRATEEAKTRIELILVICRELSNLGRTQRQQNLKEKSCTEAAPNEETQNEAEEDICREADTCRDSRPRQKRKPNKAYDWIRIIPWTAQHQDHIENGPERPKEPDSKPMH